MYETYIIVNETDIEMRTETYVMHNILKTDSPSTEGCWGWTSVRIYLARTTTHRTPLWAVLVNWTCVCLSLTQRMNLEIFYETCNCVSKLNSGCFYYSQKVSLNVLPWYEFGEWIRKKPLPWIGKIDELRKTKSLGRPMSPNFFHNYPT